MRLSTYILCSLFIGFVGCSSGTGLQPGEAQTQVNPFPTNTPVRKSFTCSVVSSPSPAIVNAYGNAGTGDLAPGTSAPAVQYKILCALDGIATSISLTGISLDSSKVSQVSAPTELADKSYAVIYQPIKGGTHAISFHVMVRGDATYTLTSNTTLQLNLSMPPNLAVSIDASPLIVSNGGAALVNMTSVNAIDCNIDRDGSTLLRPHPLLADTFSTGPLINPTTQPITTRYRASCTGTTTTPPDFVDITINPAPTAQLGIVSGPNLVDSTVIGANGSVTLNWQSNYALAGCSIRDQLNNVVGSDPLPTASGLITVNGIPASRTFTLICRDNAMATTLPDSVQVSVAAPGVTFNITSDAAITKTGNDYQLSNGATFYRIDLMAVDVVANSCSITEGLVNITNQIPKVVSTSGMPSLVTYTATCTSIAGGAVNATAVVKKPPCSGTTEIGKNSSGKWDPFVIRGFVQTNETVNPNISNDFAANFDTQTAARICSLLPLHKAVVEFDDYDGNGTTNFAYPRSGYSGGGPMKGWDGDSWETMSNKWVAKLICGCR